jgi:hypothetical protein
MKSLSPSKCLTEGKPWRCDHQDKPDKIQYQFPYCVHPCLLVKRTSPVLFMPGGCPYSYEQPSLYACPPPNQQAQQLLIDVADILVSLSDGSGTQRSKIGH